MRIIQVITDYIRRSVLTTAGDLAVRGAALPERLAGGVLNTYLKGAGAGVIPAYGALALSDGGIHMFSGVRSTNGAQTLTGFGFEPSLVVFLGCESVGANQNWSIGFDDGTQHVCIMNHTNGTIIFPSMSNSINTYIDASNGIKGNITAKGADGITITWTLTGTCQCDFIGIAIR